MSKRREIIDSIITILRNTGEFPGGVYKVLMSRADIQTFPAASIIPGSATYTPLTAKEYTAGTEQGTDGWNVHVVAYVKTATDADKEGILIDEIERIIEVVIKALQEDISLGLSYVRGVYLDEIAQIYEWDSNEGVVELIFQVKYDFEKTNP